MKVRGNKQKRTITITDNDTDISYLLAMAIDGAMAQMETSRPKGEHRENMENMIKAWRELKRSIDNGDMFC